MSVMEIFLFYFLTISIIICQQSYAEYNASTPGPISSSSSCGDSPRRLEFNHSGSPSYKLYCENNRTVIYLTDFLYFDGNYGRILYRCRDGSMYKINCSSEDLSKYDTIRRSYKYYVEAINYTNHTIRLVAPNVKQNNCSSFPIFPLAQDFFSSGVNYIQAEVEYLSANRTVSWRHQLTQPVTYLRCKDRVNLSRYIDASPCMNGSASSYSYVVVGSDFTFSDLKDSCRIEVVTLISGRNTNLSSYAQVHTELSYGFELSWDDTVDPRCYIEEDSNKRICAVVYYCDFWCQLRSHLDYADFWWELHNRLDSYAPYLPPNFFVYIEIPRMVCLVLVIAILAYTWYRRHSSVFNGIEEFLQSNNDLMPIRYSYWEIIIMTKFFREKLGQGGFGSVFKGTLSNGRFVAVKMLGRSKGNGQDFMNEVATIGRTHHVNVVHLIGFCATGSKRALVYDFMPNGSLEKYIFSKEGVISNEKCLSPKEILEISLGVSRGISYLHEGCNMQILHFDIKPHNILLDENFIPKVSDFGLARLCPLENSVVTMTAARGTIGYIAPEFFYKNIGGVSQKADVYSFGMLLFEMASKRKNVRANAEKTSQIYFPTWIFDHFNEGNDLVDIEDVGEDEIEAVKKMIVVALWCIQMKPCDRPSMSKVIEMLEGDYDSLEMPPKPYLYPRDQEHENQNVRADECTESSWCSTPSDEDHEEMLQ